jgi:hypothetical protein
MISSLLNTLRYLGQFCAPDENRKRRPAPPRSRRISPHHLRPTVEVLEDRLNPSFHLHGPKVHHPTVHLPTVHLPKIHLPKIHLPKIHLPKINKPKISIKAQGDFGELVMPLGAEIEFQRYPGSEALTAEEINLLMPYFSSYGLPTPFPQELRNNEGLLGISQDFIENRSGPDAVSTAAADTLSLIRIHFNSQPLTKWTALGRKVDLTKIAPGLNVADAAAQTFGFNIYFVGPQPSDESSMDDFLSTLAHELTHVVQYERSGFSIAKWGYKYFVGLKEAGDNYQNNPLEVEAFHNEYTIGPKLWVDYHNYLYPNFGVFTISNRSSDAVAFSFRYTGPMGDESHGTTIDDFGSEETFFGYSGNWSQPITLQPGFEITFWAQDDPEFAPQIMFNADQLRGTTNYVTDSLTAKAIPPGSAPMLGQPLNFANLSPAPNSSPPIYTFTETELRTFMLLPPG